MGPVDIVDGQLLAFGPAVAADAEGDEVPGHEVVNIAVEAMDAEDAATASGVRGRARPQCSQASPPEP